MTPWQDFLAWLAPLPSPRVLEVGTRRSKPDRSTLCRPELLRANPACSYLGTDVMPGEDVDAVADAHRLSDHWSPATFDGIVCRSTLEHLHRPWAFAREAARVVRPGGLGFVQSHQTFPVHGFPQDYFRFSREAMAELFAADVGWEVVRSEYEFPCKIVPLGNYFPHANGWCFEGEAWLNVVALVRRL